jgi:uncharacterized membrane protein
MGGIPSLTWLLFELGYIYGVLSGLIWLLISEVFIFTLIFLTMLIYRVRIPLKKSEIEEENRQIPFVSGEKVLGPHK